ncbi:KPN_02809 family neutral zinc metallopeptidase [Indioceanicola profundi]|uniref:KPN_02809 family neutral zinc metallopeptidase n=1 Tax=Indioceanicola profundi TaxID=2220096 RepID=UPI000E6AA0AB|nr:neutral zinc metallopeptidase [Indioceanicola profundi]
MRWREGRRSTNVEDRRGQSAGGFGGGFRRGGIGGGLPIGRLGLGGTVAVILLALVFGIDPMMLLGGGGMVDDRSYAPAQQEQQLSQADQELAEFVSVVLADTEDTWNTVFQRDLNADYPEPTLVLFTQAVQSACGRAGASVGPFYCPGDQQLYIDLSFYRQLREQLGAPGDFAQAYVIAHEVGHHVQTVLGISEQVREAQAAMGQAESNAMSVRMELQADCFAGLWGHYAQQRQLLEQGDLQEALNAAAAIGDDRLQRQSQGQVVPDSFTHGTSEQRATWFRRGFESGRIDSCDTFAAGAL